jgi:hypothetical protein
MSIHLVHPSHLPAVSGVNFNLAGWMAATADVSGIERFDVIPTVREGAFEHDRRSSSVCRNLREVKNTVKRIGLMADHVWRDRWRRGKKRRMGCCLMDEE